MLRVLGKGFGNLGALRVLTVCSVHDGVDHDEGEDAYVEYLVAKSLYWQAFTGALSRVRHHI
jgi:hypothetical protein